MFLFLLILLSKIKKKLVSLLVITILILSGCGNAETTSKATESSSVQSTILGTFCPNLILKYYFATKTQKCYLYKRKQKELKP